MASSFLQDCSSAKCEYIKCILKDTDVKTDYFVKVKTRIWSGTFITVNTMFVVSFCFQWLLIDFVLQ